MKEQLHKALSLLNFAADGEIFESIHETKEVFQQTRNPGIVVKCKDGSGFQLRIERRYLGG